MHTRKRRGSRSWRRTVSVLVTTAAMAIGLTVYASSATAIPRLCNPGTPTAQTGNRSCVNFQILPSNPHGTFHNSSLFVHTHTNYLHPGNKSQGGFAKTVTIDFDSDGRINFGTIPRCTPAQLSGKNISQAWRTCGPGAGAAHNAYLSPSTGVSGRTSTAPPSNFNGCTLVFKGPQQNQVLLYARVTLVANGTANCANPATNTAGNSTVLLTGTIANAGVAGFGKKLTVPGIANLPLPLDDFYATVKRGSYIQARCTASPWRVRGIFAYSGTGQKTDVSNATQPCT